jgi:hypothetical protein
MNVDKDLFCPIKGYEDRYKIAKDGRVLSISNGKNKGDIIMKPSKEGGGYLRINLRKNGNTTQVKIHRLVANAFIPNPNNYPVINHIDGNRINNTIENLEWCTHKYNLNNAFLERKRINRLSEEKAIEILKLKGIKTYREIAEMYNISSSAIYFIFSKRSWQHI